MCTKYTDMQFFSILKKLLNFLLQAFISEMRTLCFLNKCNEHVYNFLLCNTWNNNCLKTGDSLAKNLIFKSETEIAKPLSRWLTHECFSRRTELKASWVSSVISWGNTNKNTMILFDSVSKIWSRIQRTSK